MTAETAASNAQNRPRHADAIRDITKRKDGERRFRRLAGYVEATDDAIVDIGAGGRIRAWNRGAANLYGYSAEEAIGRSWIMLATLDSRADAHCLLRRVLAGEHVLSEVRRRRKGRDAVWVSEQATPHAGADDGAAGAMFVSRDMTKWKQAASARAQIDELTGLPNRATLLCELRDEVNTGSVALLILGLDRFQMIESSVGARGVEALARWNHPELGRIPACEFIEIAEESGLIVTLGAWALRKACVELHALEDKLGPACPTMNVNVSAVQLIDHTIVEIVESAIDDAGCDPAHLCLELTETAVMSDPEAVTPRLNQLKRLGITIAVDDFGTAYSSLAYLRDFPVDELKIDRSFISGERAFDEDDPIVPSIIGLAHAMGLLAVAEGVETSDQLDRLRELGCDIAQGYYLSRPVGSSRIRDLLDISA